VSSESSQTPPTPFREPGVEDATRRTRLANERTYLAWWRTGLTALAYARARAVEDALDRSSFAALGLRLPAALVAAGCLLGAAVVALILFA
jgi:uncharacterized membrane protein YidH (DUF202 family)